MEKEPIIEPVSKPRKIEVKSPHVYYLQELRDDIEVFEPHIRLIVEKIISGELLQKGEHGIFDRARERWWIDKYGFSFANKVARNEVLIRKYNPTEVQEAQSYQRELLDYIKENNQDKVRELKVKYQEKYPEQMEAIEVIFGIQDFIEKSRVLQEKNRHKPRNTEELKERLDIVRDLTEYQFLFTHFILQNNQDREFLNLFWLVGEAIASRMDALKDFNMLRRSQMTQVAVSHILTELGDSPKLAHPEEDAFKSIDLWEDPEKPIQIKGWKEEVPAIFGVEGIVFPAIQVDKNEKRSLYNSAEYFNRINEGFKIKIKKYGNKIGKSLSGYMLVIPYSKIDFINGKPAPELVDFFREHLKGREVNDRVV